MNIGLTPGPGSVPDILRAMSHSLSPADNLQCKILGPIVTPGVVDTSFTVSHNLGRIPINYIWNVDKACTVYDNARSGWTDQAMTLKCSAVSATLYLIVF